MRRERRFGRVRRRVEPDREIAHKRGDCRRRWKRIPPAFGADVARKIGISPGDVGAGALHHQAMQIPHVAFRQPCRVPGKLAHITDSVVVVERFQTILKRFAADGHAPIDHERRFDRAEGVALDGV